MTRRLRILIFAVCAAVALPLTACTRDGTADPASDVGGGVPGQNINSNNSPDTAPPGAKNPNIERWFGPKGLNPALFTDDEIACMKDYLARNPQIADSIDISRSSRDQWAINGRKTQLMCLPREKMGYLWTDEFASSQNAVFPQPFRECVAQSFATLSDDQIVNFTNQVLGELGNKIQDRCPDLANQAPPTSTQPGTTRR